MSLPWRFTTDFNEQQHLFQSWFHRFFVVPEKGED